MKVNSAVSFGRSGIRGKGALLSVLLIAALLAAVVPFFGSIASAHASTGTVSFDNVQVTVRTSSGIPDSFTVSAYNTTGGLVASYQSQYPAAAFELPSGSYIFTATATQQQTIYYPVGYAGTATASSGSSGSSGSGVIVSPPIKCCSLPANCCPYTQPVIEYGYASQQVSGPTSMTISTALVNQTATSTLRIMVTYPNGTAASGVYVSASVLGDSYGWAYSSNAVSMYNSTDSSGVVSLIAPAAPVLVSASTSIPIVLPYSQSTTQVTVAGVKVNVTAYWDPNYVSFGGQVLIIPPQTGGNIVLQYQPQSTGPILYATGQTTSTFSCPSNAICATPTVSRGSATGQSSPATSTTQGAKATSAQATSTVSQTTTSDSNLLLVSGIAVALAIAALSVAIFVAKSRPRSAPQ